MADDIVGSRLKAQIGYGDTADINNPASLLPGQKVKRSAVAQTLIQPCTVPAEGADGATRTVSAKPIKPAFGMKGAASGAKVPTKSSRSTG